MLLYSLRRPKNLNRLLRAVVGASPYGFAVDFSVSVQVCGIFSSDKPHSQHW